MTRCEHCDECEKKPVSFWELCDSGDCIPDALIMSPPVCGSCGDNCTHTLKYITLNGLKAQLDLGDELVKAHPGDPCAGTLADKLDLSDTCFERTLDQTHATCPGWKWKLRLKNNCIKTSLIELTDGPGTYANCNVVEGTENEDCGCPLTTCPAGVLVSKCDGSGWERQCPNQLCANNTIETNYNWHNNNVQIFGYSTNNNGISGPQFLCPKKKFIAKVKRSGLQTSEQFENNKILYAAPDAYSAVAISNIPGQIVIYDSGVDASIGGTDISTTSSYVVQVRIPHSNWYETGQSGSALVNRGVHTIRHQIMRYKSGMSNPRPLLDYRMEGTIFKRESLSSDTFIGVDDINDLNRFSDMTNDLTVSGDNPAELKMDAGLGRTLRGHGFGQTTVERLEKDDILFFIYKVQTFPVGEENGCTFGQIAYVGDGTEGTNGAGAGLQWFVRELDEYGARMESDAQTYTLASDL